jgi:hypothetical protein
MGNAQVKFGAKAGLNISNFTGDTENSKSKEGLYIGGYVRIPIASKFSIQPELLFSMQGAKEKTAYPYYEPIRDDYFWGTAEADYKFNYINIPLMFQYEVIDRLRLEAGPQVGLNVGSKFKLKFKEGYRSYFIKADADELKMINFSLNVGGNYELQNGLNFSARYSCGLSNISEDSNSDVKNPVFSFGVGYTF